MLQRLNPLRGCPVFALDGDIGAVKDFYFDDDTWTIRYVVADTGTWLQGRRVLIPLSALHEPDWHQRRIPVRLTREQVRNSPDVETQRPVSRQAEAASLKYYGYPYYWGGPALWGAVGAPSLMAGLPVQPMAIEAPSDERDTHLRSCAEVTGYHVRATDGEIGHVDDFVIDPGTWSIAHLLLDTSNWIGGKSVLIAPASIQKISWSDRTVAVSLSRNAVGRSPEPDFVR
jgi:uncharacterized protein YrrD